MKIKKINKRIEPWWWTPDDEIIASVLPWTGWRLFCQRWIAHFHGSIKTVPSPSGEAMCGLLTFNQEWEKNLSGNNYFCLSEELLLKIKNWSEILFSLETEL